MLADENATDRLSSMMLMQRELQEKIIGMDPMLLTDDARTQYINITMLALEDELHEALRETPWKPWSKSTELNRDKYVDELVDAWHFFMNLMLVVGVTPSELFVRYIKKNVKNHDRADTGYAATTG